MSYSDPDTISGGSREDPHALTERDLAHREGNTDLSTPSGVPPSRRVMIRAWVVDFWRKIEWDEP